MSKQILNSLIPNHEGECVPTWTNNNKVLNCVDNGVTGFFRNVKVVTILGMSFRRKVGEEFHGIVKCGNVRSTINEF